MSYNNKCMATVGVDESSQQEYSQPKSV